LAGGDSGDNEGRSLCGEGVFVVSAYRGSSGSVTLAGFTFVERERGFLITDASSVLMLVPLPFSAGARVVSAFFRGFLDAASLEAVATFFAGFLAAVGLLV